MYGAAAGDIYLGILQGKGRQAADSSAEQTEPRYSGSTILTAAIGEALLKAGATASSAKIIQAVAQSLRAWADRHPEAQYSEQFANWLSSDEVPQADILDMSPIGWVSAAGWLYSSLERTEDVARAIAETYTTNKDVIYAAECVADLIFLARTGRSKAELLAFAQLRFGYKIAPFAQALRKDESVDLNAQTALPLALAAFAQSTTLTQTVRNVSHLGGGHNEAAVAGSLLEACNGLDASTLSLISKFVPEDCLRVMADISQFEGADKPLLEDREKVEDLLAQFTGPDPRSVTSAEADELSLQNEVIQKAIEGIYAAGSTPDVRAKAEDALESALLYSLRSDGQILVAWNVDFANQRKMDEDAKNFFCNGLVRFYEGIRADIRIEPRTTAITLDGRPATALFTNPDELHGAQSVELPLRTALHLAVRMRKGDGVVFNPFGRSVALDYQTVVSLLEKSGEDVSPLLTDARVALHHPSAVSRPQNNEEELMSFPDRMAPPPGHEIPWDRSYTAENMDIDVASIMAPVMSSRFQVLNQTGDDAIPTVEGALIKGALQDAKLLVALKAEVYDPDEIAGIAKDRFAHESIDISEAWIRIMPVAVTGANGNPHTAVFTDPSQANDWKNTYKFLTLTVEEALHLIENMEENVGLALNPFSANVHMDHETAMRILQDIRHAKYPQSE